MDDYRCDVLEYLVNTEYISIGYIFREAIKYDHLDILRCLHEERNYSFEDMPLADDACFARNIEIVEYLLSKGCREPSFYVGESSLINEDIACLQFLHDNNIQVLETPYQTAASGCRFKSLEWLHQNKYVIEDNACVGMSKWDSVDVVQSFQWLVDHGASWDKEACLTEAKFYGVSELVDYLQN